MITTRICTHFIFYVLLATASLYSRCKGGAICYECNSKTDAICTPQSLSKARKASCPRGNDFCAVYKKEPPGNSSTHQYIRYCDSECRRFNTTYTIGRFLKTKHCKLCCDGDLCNDYTIDPCNPESKAGRLGCRVLVMVLLGVTPVLLNYFL